MRAQIAIEYLFIMGFAAMLLIGYLAVAGTVAGKTIDASKAAAADRIARQFQNELLLAAQVHDGYSRSFMVDETVREIPVTISNGTGLIGVAVGDMFTQVRVPPYQGNPASGVNTITREDGVIRFQ